MTVLVTRGWPGAERTAQGLRDRGVEPIISPVMDISFRAAIDVDLTDVQALVFTSANGVRAWGPRRFERDLPVMAVASATADAARSIGFKSVTAAGGDVSSLVQLIRSTLDPQAGDLLHVRGIHVAGDLKGDLKADGFRVREAIGYGAVPVDMLSEEAIAAIISGAPVQVVIHSARSAKTFLDLLRRFGLENWLGSVSVYGMSDRALRPLSGAGFGGLYAAAEPDEDQLLDLVTQPMRLARVHNAS